MKKCIFFNILVYKTEGSKPSKLNSYEKGRTNGKFWDPLLLIETSTFELAI